MILAFSTGFDNEIIIRRPINEVYAFLIDFENMPKWNYYLVSVKKTSPGAIGVGTTFHQIRKSDSQDYHIVELNYPDTIAIETLPPERKLLMRFKLINMGQDTRLIDTWQMAVPFLLSFFIKPFIKKAAASNLQKLKTLLETGEVVLQDGRVIKL
jgi:hypothetical protein